MAALAHAEASIEDTHQDKVFDELEAYDWAHDVEFQNGLRSILASTNDSTQREYLTLRARCFYYSR